MLDAPLVAAIGDYDHTRDLATGSVTVDGVEFEIFERPEDMFERALEGEFAASEMSLAALSAMVSQGDDRFAALPVFPARSFRHGAIYVHVDGPRSVEDLASAQIGIPIWVQTAGVYVRGMLASRYGLDLTTITWVRAGVDVPGREEPAPFDAGPHQILSAADRTLDELLLSREVDAVISARPPASVERDDPRVRRLFDDPRAEDEAYYRDTGVFPIMHAIVVRRDVLAREPRLAPELARAFTEAKDRALRRALAATVPSYPLPWAATDARSVQALLGDDFWPYGVDANEPTLRAFLADAHRQGLTDRLLEPSMLFA